MFPRRFGMGNMGRDARAMRIAQARLGGTVQRRGYYYVPLDTPWVFTNFNLTAYSTVGTATLIDMSSEVVSAPANTSHVRAWNLWIMIRDSVTFPQVCTFSLGPDSTPHTIVYCYGGNMAITDTAIITANDDGDLYYTCLASGTLTLDIYMKVNGYFM